MKRRWDAVIIIRMHVRAIFDGFNLGTQRSEDPAVLITHRALWCRETVSILHSFTSSSPPQGTRSLIHQLIKPHTALIHQLIKSRRALIHSFTHLPAYLVPHSTYSLVHSFIYQLISPAGHSFTHSAAHQAPHSTHSLIHQLIKPHTTLIHLAMSGPEPALANATYYHVHSNNLFHFSEPCFSVAGLLNTL